MIVSNIWYLVLHNDCLLEQKKIRGLWTGAEFVLNPTAFKHPVLRLHSYRKPKWSILIFCQIRFFYIDVCKSCIKVQCECRCSPKLPCINKVNLNESHMYNNNCFIVRQLNQVISSKTAVCFFQFGFNRSFFTNIQQIWHFFIYLFTSVARLCVYFYRTERSQHWLGELLEKHKPGVKFLWMPD